MKIARNWGRPVFRWVAALLVPTAIFLSFLPTAHAQYYYQPSQDYYRNDTAEGTVVGGAFGAITGAILGGKKDRGAGALIGAGVGALTGNLLGRSKDRADARRAATGQAVVANANRQAAVQAVTNRDLIRMTQAGVGEDVIISTLRGRGARLDLSPEGIISLKENGVSDRVLIAAQERYRGAPLPATATIVTDPVWHRAVVVPPPAYRYRPHYHHHGAPVHYWFDF